MVLFIGWLEHLRLSSAAHWTLSERICRSGFSVIESVPCRVFSDSTDSDAISAGSLTLTSSDPFAYPRINPGFLTTEFDRHAVVYAVKEARRFVQAKPWQGFVVGRYGAMGAAETDDEILDAARESVVTIWHPSCTARMSPANASWGVVGPDLRVKGTSGLRIVDASVFVRSLAYC